ncbi:hypothetical protein WKK05_37200 (plasmid) [Nostoc sp. UHCC 0302]|uniref:hypothetical protein n=1 Tax=Nostoc sp. UHCC 0302 TaxID=3134896 RepID=UPI00311CB82B
MLQELEIIAQIVEQRLEQHETRGRTLQLPFLVMVDHGDKGLRKFRLGSTEVILA